MDEWAGASRPKIHRIPEKKGGEGQLYVSKAVLILCLTMLLVVIVPAIWSWHKSGKSTVAAVIPPASQTTPAAADEGSIPVHDESGQLVGQLTKMPADADRNATINATSNVDQKSGKELMNIISKY